MFRLPGVVPLHQVKAEFFRMLGHPVRIRVLELLGEGPKVVRELLDDVDIEPSSLSQRRRYSPSPAESAKPY